MKKILIALVFVACRSESSTKFQGSATLQSLDKQMIVEKLLASTIPVSHLPEECARIYEGVESLSSLGSVVRDQYRRAETWEASCQAKDRRSCVVKFLNSKNEDEEFMAEYRFALDDEQSLIESTLTCVLAG